MIDTAKTGAYIAYLRQKAGMTQSQLAAMMNVTHQAVSKWENGTALPDVQTMLNLSAVFGVTMEQMLTVPQGAMQEEKAAQTAQSQTVTEETQEQPAKSAAEQSEQENAPQEEPVPGKKSQRVDIKRLVSIAPFLGEETVAGIVQGMEDEIDIDQLTALMPFLPSEKVDKIALHQAEKGIEVRWASIAPFMSQSAQERLLERLMEGEQIDWKNIRLLAPFASKGAVARLLERLEEMDDRSDAFLCIAPFATREALSRHVLSLHEKGALTDEMIRRCAHMLPRETIRKVLSGGEQARGAERTVEIHGTANVDLSDIGTIITQNVGSAVSAVREALAAVLGGNPNAYAAKKAKVDAGQKETDRKDGRMSTLARAAVDEGDWEYLTEHFDRFDRKTREEIMLNAVEACEGDIVEELFDHCDADMRKTVVRGALENVEYDLIEGLYDRLEADLRNEVLMHAAHEYEWDFVEEHFERADMTARREVLRYAIDEAEWDLVDRHFDVLNMEERGQAVMRATHESDIDFVDRHFDEIGAQEQENILLYMAREEEFDFISRHSAAMKNNADMCRNILVQAAQNENWDYVRQQEHAADEITRYTLCLFAMESGEEEIVLQMARKLSQERLDELTDIAVKDGLFDLAKELTEIAK